MAIQTLPQGLTFDDVSLIPGRSDVLPVSVNVRTKLTRNISLNIPVVSAAMDTVTESSMAIAMAQQGGIGFIHRNMPIEQQVLEVDRVKRSESGMIVDPVTMSPENKISDALGVMRRYKISGVPVTRDGKLVGILTNRDLRFETRLDLPIGDVMTKENLITVPVGTTLEEAEKLLHEHRIEKLPVVDEQYNLRGLITVKDIRKKRQFPLAAKDEKGRLRAGAAVGATGDFLERAQELARVKVDVLAVDTAHAHSTRVMEAVRTLRRALPEVDLVAGNVATFEAACDLIHLDVDAIKVGVGPGSICTTRMVTGAGVPQITAIMECQRPAQEAGVPVIADGGIKFSGDITKALAAGASAVMVGNLLAGCDESPGEFVLYQGRTFKAYRGMGSLGVMEGGASDRYSQETQTQRDKLIPEGIEGRVPYKGPLESMITQLVGGLKSGMGYCGCADLNELHQRAHFVRITPAGLRESHVHDVVITKEAPNYRVDQG
ncbi:MAG: IMP dehydrogenase [Acidobacteria bacterium]|nr:IMP dehydrogenase [Acidobacteriota bacterium]